MRKNGYPKVGSFTPQLLHVAARPRRATARDLYRLAHAQDARRHYRRRVVRFAGRDRDHDAQRYLRRLRQYWFRGGFILRPEGSGSSEQRGCEQESLVGDELPDHVRISVSQSLKIATIWLAVWLAPVAALLFLLGGSNVYSQIAVFFSKMAVVTFGGAYAVLAYVAQQAVENYHWLKPGEMLDGLGMAETTPGPLIMVLQFVGFMAAYHESGALPPLLAGALGGLLATWVTFTPCFLWIFLGAPYIEQLRGNKALTGALSAITAAVVGVILNLAVWFAIHAIFRQTVPVHGLCLAFDLPVPASINPWALLLSISAVIAIFRFKAGLLQTLAASAAGGAAFYAIDLISVAGV
jgi:chromate transporter